MVEVFDASLERKVELDSVIKTFTLVKGKTDNQEEMGTFKGNFRVVSLEDEPLLDTLATATEKRDDFGRM